MPSVRRPMDRAFSRMNNRIRRVSQRGKTSGDASKLCAAVPSQLRACLLNGNSHSKSVKLLSAVQPATRSAADSLVFQAQTFRSRPFRSSATWVVCLDLVIERS